LDSNLAGSGVNTIEQVGSICTIIDGVAASRHGSSDATEQSSQSQGMERGDVLTRVEVRMVYLETCEWLVLVALSIHHQKQEGTAVRIVLTQVRNIRYTNKLGTHCKQLREKVSYIGHVPQAREAIVVLVTVDLAYSPVLDTN
jgi:hypothetical protein